MVLIIYFVSLQQNWLTASTAHKVTIVKAMLMFIQMAGVLWGTIVHLANQRHPHSPINALKVSI